MLQEPNQNKFDMELMIRDSGVCLVVKTCQTTIFCKLLMQIETNKDTSCWSQYH